MSNLENPICFAFGFIVGVLLIQLLGTIRERELEDEKILNSVLCKWIDIINDDGSISDRLNKRGIKTIAILGDGRVAILLHDNLYSTVTKVRYFITDTGSGNIYLETAIPSYKIDNINFARPEEFDVDAVIAIDHVDYEKHIDRLREIYSCQILKLEDIVYEE